MQSVKFSEDVAPLTDIKLNPGRFVNQVNHTQRPVLLTSRGRGVAVLSSLQAFEKEREDREFMRAVIQGMDDVETGRTCDLTTAKQRLGLT